MAFNIPNHLMQQQQSYLEEMKNQESCENQLPKWEEVKATILNLKPFLFYGKSTTEKRKDLRSFKFENFELKNFETLEDKIRAASSFLQAKIQQASDNQKVLDETEKEQIRQLFEEIISSNKTSIPRKKKYTTEDLSRLPQCVPILLKINEAFIKYINRFQFAFHEDLSNRKFKASVDKLSDELFPESFANVTTLKQLSSLNLIPDIKTKTLKENFFDVSQYLTGIALRIKDENREFTASEITIAHNLIHELKKKAKNIFQLSDTKSKIEKLNTDLQKANENLQEIKSKITLHQPKVDSTETNEKDIIISPDHKEHDNALIDLENESRKIERNIRDLKNAIEYLQNHHKTLMQKNFTRGTIETELPISYEKYKLLKNLDKYREPSELIKTYLLFVDHLKEQVSFQPKNEDNSNEGYAWYNPFRLFA